MIIRRGVWLLVLLAMAHVSAAQAPDRAPNERAFSSFALGAGGAAHLFASDTDDNWSSPWGGEIFLGTPFYAGRTRVGVQFIPYAARSEDVPDFSSYFIFAGWGIGFPLRTHLEATAGFRVGIFQMRFDRRFVQSAQRIEQEVAARLVGALRYKQSGWAVYLQAGYGTVLLSRPLKQSLVTLGISRSFSTPPWLQKALR